jgi:hypothetical protein
MKPQFITGYLKVAFRTPEYGNVNFLVSRLVLFVHGTEKYLVIDDKIVYYYDLFADHKSGDVLDNRIENLQWETHDDNVELVHIRQGKRNNCIAGYDIRGNLVGVFASSYILKKLLFERVSTLFENICISNTTKTENLSSYYNMILKYTTREFYYQNKDKISDIFICKPHDSNYKITLEQYEILSDGRNISHGRLIGRFNKRSEIEERVGDIRIYPRKNRKPYYNTNLTYQDIIGNGFIWRIIYGIIVILKRDQINARNLRFERYFPEIDAIIEETC